MRKNAIMNFYEQVLENIKKILKDKGIKQAVAADWIDVDPSQFSKILNGKVLLSLKQLADFARGVELREIDIITYPIQYRAPETDDEGPAEVLLQMKLKKEKKDQVLKLVFGENNIEILNK